MALKLPTALLVTLVLSAPAVAHAQSLWKCPGAQGVSQYVQKKPSGVKCSQVKPAAPPPSRPYLPLQEAASVQPQAAPVLWPGNPGFPPLPPPTSLPQGLPPLLTLDN